MKLFLYSLLALMLHIGALSAQDAEPSPQDETQIQQGDAPVNQDQAAESTKDTKDIAKDAAVTPEKPLKKTVDPELRQKLLEEHKKEQAERAPTPTPAQAKQDAQHIEPPPVIKYNRTQRFSRPIDPVTEYRNAQNVTFLNVSFNDLPEIMRADIGDMLGTCQESMDDYALIKAYSYVSDLIRSRGLSPNYIIDFSKFTGKPKSSCAKIPPCDEDGCMFMSYNTVGYEHWKKDLALRVGEWSIHQSDDQRASAVPQQHKPAVLSLFDFTTRCDDKSKGGDDVCTSTRIWLSGGLSDYIAP